MILSQKEIRASIDAGEISFDPPLEERQFGEASVDLRIGYLFTKLKQVDAITVSIAEGFGGIAGLGLWLDQDLTQPDEHGRIRKYTLEPNNFVLAFTYESITIPNNLIAMVQGRSSYARVGLSMHQTAPWIQPGFSAPILLEIMNSGPLKIELTPKVDRPCQLTFFQLTSPLSPDEVYGAKASDTFQAQKHPFKN